MTKPLLHWTCAHSEPGIRASGVVVPRPQPVLDGRRLSWWTDMQIPDRIALGLTRVVAKCDRTAFRFEPADPSLIMPWWQWCRTQRLDRSTRARLEEFGAPMHWFVAENPVPVRAPQP